MANFENAGPKKNNGINLMEKNLTGFFEVAGGKKSFRKHNANILPSLALEPSIGLKFSDCPPSLSRFDSGHPSLI